MIDFTTKNIKDDGQSRLTDGVMSNVEFSGFNLEIPEDKKDLFFEIFDSMKDVKSLIDATNLVSDISKDFKANDPRIKKIFELIGGNDELIADILSFMYNRIAIESNTVAAIAMKKIRVDNGEDKDFETTLDEAYEAVNEADKADSDDYGAGEVIASDSEAHAELKA